MTDELIGKQIGGYEILNQIGQGGMATVYRAQQISMNRIVALKVLPLQFLNDDTYLQRFEREVKIVSQLEHRNIVPVHDYGQHHGQPYIVMRYMPAGSIDDLLQSGPLDVETILSILSQIAPALDYAHTKNVLHRDLKPSNVLMDDNGGAFITDFGIARILGEQGPGITTQGVVGTPSYMSPEQAQAHDLDGRSDVYSLGVMLFEMLTGRRPFESDTPYSIAVLQVTAQPPAPRSYNPSITEAVEKVIYKALKKDPDERYSTASELAEALRSADKEPQRAFDTPPHPIAISPQLRPPAPLVQQAALPPAISPPPSVSYPMVAPPVQYYPPVSDSRGHLIPPPSQVKNRVRKRRGGSMLFNVVLGGMIGCGLLAALVLIATLVVNTITHNTPSAPAATTAPDDIGDTVINTPSGTKSVPELDATSAAARQTLLPGSHSTAQTAQTPSAVPIGIRPTATRIPALEDATGTLVYFDDVQDKGFEVVTLDLKNGTGSQLTDDNSTNSYPVPSPDGTQIAFQSNRDGDFDIYVMTVNGSGLIKVTYNVVTDRMPAWSPDGQWIVFSSDTRGDGNYDLFKVHPNGTGLEPVFSNGQRNSAARWSPDGKFIIFTTGKADDANTWDIGRVDVQTGTFSLLTKNDTKDWSPVFSADGKSVFYLTPGQGFSAIWAMNADGSNPHALFDGPGYEWGVSPSPDASFIVFNTDVTGRDELYLMTADGTKVQQITDTGGMYAAWIPKK